MRLADTNILVYAADASPEEQRTRARAAEVLKEEDLCLSVQVLQGFYHQATRPVGRLRMTHEQALAFMEPFMGLPGVAVTQELFSRAAQVADRYRIACWDAAILEAARMQGCDAVYSGDLNEGQSYNGVVEYDVPPISDFRLLVPVSIACKL